MKNPVTRFVLCKRTKNHCIPNTFCVKVKTTGVDGTASDEIPASRQQTPAQLCVVLCNFGILDLVTSRKLIDR